MNLALAWVRPESDGIGRWEAWQSESVRGPSFNIPKSESCCTYCMPGGFEKATKCVKDVFPGPSLNVSGGSVRTFFHVSGAQFCSPSRTKRPRHVDHFHVSGKKKVGWLAIMYRHCYVAGYCVAMWSQR